MVAVPDLTGHDASESVEAALREGLVPVVEADRDARASVGRVRLQSPAAGTVVRAGSNVTLSVGGGFSGAMSDVPNVVGLSTSEASARLSAAGFSTQVVRVAVRPGVFAMSDQVLGQTPVGRFASDHARVVRIFVP